MAYKETIYIDLQSHLNRSKSKSYKEMVMKSYTPVMRLSEENNLIEGDFFDENGNLKEDAKVYESNLTENGKKMFWDFMMKWLKYTDRTQKYDNIEMLEKYYLQIKKKHNL
ncbi:MAG: hypothetical protein ACSHWV_10545 [Cellulophaga fucicola]